MFELQQSSVQNHLLRALPEKDFALLRGKLDRLTVANGYSLSKPGDAVDYIYMPESGFASVTQPHRAGKVEIGIIGREGLVGIQVLLNAGTCPHDIFVQMPGVFLRIATADFLDAMAKSTAIQRLLLRYVQSFLIQTASTSMSNATLNLECRLARWLLMAHDRGEDDSVKVTHEFLAMMLAVRRPGVTVATHILEGYKFIRATRGLIAILNRAGLEDLAGGEAYGVAEAEHERLIGFPLSRSGAMPQPVPTGRNSDGAAVPVLAGGYR
jgi:CRP-like cAMP-binding protein